MWLLTRSCWCNVGGSVWLVVLTAEQWSSACSFFTFFFQQIFFFFYLILSGSFHAHYHDFSHTQRDFVVLIWKCKNSAASSMLSFCFVFKLLFPNTSCDYITWRSSSCSAFLINLIIIFENLLVFTLGRTFAHWGYGPTCLLLDPGFNITTPHPHCHFMSLRQFCNLDLSERLCFFTLLSLRTQ